jgi:hypothetical protein
MLLLSRAFPSAISIAGADNMDSEMLHTSNLPHQRDDDLMMLDLSELSADASNDGTMLGRDVVKRDRARLEDIELEAAAKIGEGCAAGSSDPWAATSGPAA